MTNLRRRDRTLVFRLNQSEYDRLMEAAATHGDRSISEFIRVAVMNAVGEPSEKEDRVRELEHRIQRLEQQLLSSR